MRQELEASYAAAGYGIVWGDNGRPLYVVRLPPPPQVQVAHVLADILMLVECGVRGVGEWDPASRMYRGWQTPHMH